MAKFKDIGSVRIGHAFRGRVEHSPSGSVQLIQPRDISSDGRIVFGGSGPLLADVPSPRLLQKNDVLLVNRGRFASAVFDLPGPTCWLTPSSVLVLSLNTEKVLPHYVACFLNSSAGQKLLLSHSELTTVPFLKVSNLENMPIPIPPLKRQEALAAFAAATVELARLSDRKQKLYSTVLNQEFQPQAPIAKETTS